MAAYRDKKTNRWRYRIQLPLPSGKTVRLSGSAPKKTNTKAAAEGAERAHVARAHRPTAKEGGDAPTFREWADRYMETVAPGQSPSEQIGKRRKLDNVLLPALGDLPINEIGRAELDGVKARLRGKAPGTINNHLTVVGAMMSYAVECEVLQHAPKVQMLKVPAQSFEVYSDEELDGLLELAAGDAMMTCALLLGSDAGLRAGEIRALHRADVVGEGLRVVRSDFEGKLKSTKSGRARTVKMSARLATAVDRALRQHIGPRVLARVDGSPWTKESMVWCAPPKGWHALRHAFCTRLAAAGVPVDRIRKMAGHSSVVTTQRYMHAAPAELDDAVSVFDRQSRCQNAAKTSEGPKEGAGA